MRCCFHHDREAVGQCAHEHCKVYLCQECIMESRKSVTNMILCRVCVLNAIREKRGSAKNDILLFKIGAIAGAIITLCLIVFEVAFGLPAVLQEVGSIDALTGLVSILLVAISLVVQSYGAGAGLVGIKKTLLWCWRSTIKIIPLTILAAIIFLVLFLLILAVGSVIGVFAMPYWWYKARKTIRETAYIETLPESAYTYPPPPPPQYQTAQTTNTAANFCRNCGKPTATNATFCIHCGKQI